MFLINIVVVIVVVGVVLWLINRLIPMQRSIKKMLNVVVIVCLVLWLLSSFGVIQGLGNLFP